MEFAHPIEWYGSSLSLAELGNHRVFGGESGALVIPAGEGLVAAAPSLPVRGMAGWRGPGERSGEQAGGLGRQRLPFGHEAVVKAISPVLR